MSHPRLHEDLQALFEQKNEANLKACLENSAFREFQKTHGINVPPSELVKVFTHTSFSHEFRSPHQEQLEFLGDAVVQLVLTEELYRLYPMEKEGMLSKLRSAIVNEKTLSALALKLDLGSLLLVGRGEFNKKLYLQEAVLADTFEALLGCIYKHDGLEKVKNLFFKWLLEVFPKALDFEFLENFDAKSKLQELALAKYKKLPRYQATSVQDKFEVQLWINDELKTSGIFSSKKEGEKELAKEIIMKGSI
jgi:ribonuclease-3